MSKHHSFVFGLAIVSLLHAGCREPESPSRTSDGAIEAVYEGKLTLPQAQASCGCRLETVQIGGTVFHFGLDLSQNPPASYPFQSTVAGVRVSIAELPITRLLNIRSDANGKWGFTAIKVSGKPLPISLVYDLAGYVTTKSQLFQVGDAGLTDVAVQFPTAAYFTAAKGQIEQQIGGLIGAPYTLSNVLVTTVGKSWASMYSPLLPHGDPGAHVSIAPAITFPPSLGPVYFNESVAPDPTLTSTSVDGGVLFGNLAKGSYTVTATKAPFTYAALTFVIEDGISLYVASPPHAIQGTNDAPPGQGAGGAGGTNGGMGGAGGTPQPMVCSGTRPARALITDFSDAGVGTSGIFFGTAPNIGGGTYSYAAPGLSAPVLSLGPAPAGSTGQALDVVANPGLTTDPSNNWSGFGLGFNMCVDASAYTGVQFTITGSLGNCAVTFSPVFSENNSVHDDPAFGSCTAASCYTGESRPLAPGTDIVRFTDVIGGSPQTMVDPRALTGVQWQLNAPTDGVSVCSASFAITDITFVNDASGAGGMSGGGGAGGNSGQLACVGSAPTTPLLTGSTASPVGGTFTFAASTLTAPTVTPTLASDGSIQSLQVTAAPGTTTDPFNAYSGFGLYFSKPACVDASAYSGVQFTVSGSLGTCSLNVFTSISEDSAMASAGPVGRCTATSCVSPYSAPLGLGTNVVPFTAMSGGTPDPTVDASALLNVGWTLNVPTDGVTAPCTASFTISDVSFVK
jgi:hypothetical protein